MFELRLCKRSAQQKKKKKKGKKTQKGLSNVFLLLKRFLSHFSHATQFYQF